MSVLFPEGKKVTIKDIDAVVQKLSFKKHMEVSGLLTSLKFNNAADFVTSADSMIQIFAIATNLEKAWLEENLDPVIAIELLNAVKEVNGFLALKQAAESVKKDDQLTPAQQ